MNLKIFQSLKDLGMIFNRGWERRIRISGFLQDVYFPNIEEYFPVALVLCARRI